ncbi:MAG: saccharopine dehydrogenase NADP-binding domain-containing protein [Saccharofermentans sp.]|nr:saccharopine dehydrogenase NADP-binding domain-containing protein [Saccharofermentans sp.]
MKRILILGCNDIAKRLLLTLCEDPIYHSGICIASRNKEDCDELRDLAMSKGQRITTAGIDLNNVSGAMMMIRITAPELVINLLPPEMSPNALELAHQANACYIDGALFDVPAEPTATSLLSKQFESFGKFSASGKTAIVGCGLNPAGITAIVKRVAKRDFSEIKSIDIVEVKSGASPKAAKKADEKTLFSEDVKKPQMNSAVGTAHPVFTIKDGEPKAVEAFSVSSKSKDGKTVFVSDNDIVTDFIKEIGSVKNVRFLAPGAKPEERIPPKDLIDTLKDLGLLSEEKIKVGEAMVSPLDVVAEVLPKMDKPGAEGEQAPLTGKYSLEIYITGVKDGKDLTRLYRITGDHDKSMADNGCDALRYLNGTVLIESCKLMCNDKWNKPGIYTPAAFDGELLYSAMISAGIEIEETDSNPLS